jgi:DNA-binding protein YbaB
MNFRMKVCFSSLALMGLVAGGCNRANEALDATRGMPGQLEVMTDEVKQTREGTEVLSKKMETMDGRMESMNTTMNSMNSNLGETQKILAETAHAIRAQTLMVALTDALSASAMQFSPIGALPGAKAFALNAEPQQLIALTQLWMNGLRLAPVPKTAEPTPEESAQLRSLKHRLFTLQAIAGSVSREKVNAIIAAEITNLKGGLYTEAALAFLQLRAEFLGGFVWKNAATNGILNVSVAHEATRALAELDFIVTQTFSKDIGYKIESMGLDANLTVQKTGGMRAMWLELHGAIGESDAIQIKEEYQDDQDLASLRKYVEQALSRWPEAKSQAEGEAEGDAATTPSPMTASVRPLTTAPSTTANENTPAETKQEPAA